MSNTHYLLNAFSLNMIDYTKVNQAQIEVFKVNLEQARHLAQRAVSAVGHMETAVVFSRLLETLVAPKRMSVTLQSGDTALVGQYSGPRLPEGATTLPEGATITWLYVTVLKASSMEADLCGTLSPRMLEACKDLIRSDRFIGAIKQYREFTSTSLADAVKAMEGLRQEMIANDEMPGE